MILGSDEVIHLGPNLMGKVCNDLKSQAIISVDNCRKIVSMKELNKRYVIDF